MKSVPQPLASLVHAILETQPDELNCQEFFDGAAAYLDSCIVETPATAPDLERVRQHLRACPECAEAFEAMLCGARAGDSEGGGAADATGESAPS